LNNNSHSITINRIRFFLIILIVFNHINFFKNVNIFKENFILIDIATPTLAYLSGYLFFLNYESGKFHLKLKSKIKSLIIPYILWSLSIHLLYQLLIHVLRTYNIYSLTTNNTELFVMKEYIKILVFPENIFWYLQNLILILPFTPFIFYFIHRKYLFFPLFLVLIYFSINFNLYFSIRFLPFFILGSYMSLYKELNLFNIRVNNFLSFLITITLIYVFNLITGNTIYLILIKLFLVVLFTNILYVFLETNIFRYLNQYLKYSFFIFCTHILISKIITKGYIFLFNSIFLNHELQFNILCLFFGILIIFFSIISARLLYKLCPKFYLLLTGQRI
jgi:hypothetical protein